jgi:hypothetical protein
LQARLQRRQRQVWLRLDQKRRMAISSRSVSNAARTSGSLVNTVAAPDSTAQAGAHHSDLGSREPLLDLPTAPSKLV